jgi:hypothetical protein
MWSFSATMALCKMNQLRHDHGKVLSDVKAGVAGLHLAREERTTRRMSGCSLHSACRFAEVRKVTGLPGMFCTSGVVVPKDASVSCTSPTGPLRRR